MKFISILTRRLREGKTYEDFRRAWYHTDGYGTTWKRSTAIDAFDQRERVKVRSKSISPHLIRKRERRRTDQTSRMNPIVIGEEDKK